MTRLALVFDDGFGWSCARIAELCAARGLGATFAVLGDPQHVAHAALAGDWGLWRELRAAGHRIDPHGWRHGRMWEQPHAEAVADAEATLAVFDRELPGFDPATAVWHYPYNCGTAELDHWLLTRVAAVRCGGDGLNSAAQLAERRLSSTGHGPGNCDMHLLAFLDQVLQVRPAAAVYTAHGLADQGWGPLSADGLARALDRIVAEPEFSWWTLDGLAP